MSLYFVVEGKRTEPKLFRKWLPLLLPGVREVERMEDSEEGTFFMVSGQGYPAYKKLVEQAVRDCVQSRNGFKLVVCVDAEELASADRAAEICEVISEAQRGAPREVPHTVVVADCCIESWLLGNAKLVRRNPVNVELLEYKRHYDVVRGDPELMPQRSGDRNRADTHIRYLKAAFRERGLSYAKNHPGEAGESHYFRELVARATELQVDGTRHLRSFAGFLGLAELCGDKAAPTRG